MRYTFCTIDSGASTAWLRAGMIAKFMKAEKKRECRWFFGEKNIEDSLKDANKNDCYVYVKTIANKNDCYVYVKTGYKDDLIFQTKEKCGKLILDISDDFSLNKTKTWSSLADAVLYDTNEASVILKNQGYENRIKIKHLHSNFDDRFYQARKKLNAVPSIIGYLGLDKQLDNSKEIIKTITNMGFAWYQANPNIATNSFHSVQLDLKIIHSLNKENLKLKPHNKIMNMYSYGIPAFYSPYESYTETISENKILNWFCCYSIEEMFEKFKTLVTNPTLYRDASNEAFLLSQRFHVKKYEDCYRDFFKFVE